MDTKLNNTTKYFRAFLNIILLFTIIVTLSIFTYFMQNGSYSKEKEFFMTVEFSNAIESIFDEVFRSGRLANKEALDLTVYGDNIKIIAYDKNGKVLPVYSNIGSWSAPQDDEIAFDFKVKMHEDKSKYIDKEVYKTKLVAGEQDFYNYFRHHYYNVRHKKFIDSGIDHVQLKINYTKGDGQLVKSYYHFSNYKKDSDFYYYACPLIFLLGLVIGLYLMLTTGKWRLLNWLDKIYTEIIVVLFVSALATAFQFFVWFARSFERDLYSYNTLFEAIFSADKFLLIMIVAVFLMLSYHLLLSLVRNLKAGNLANRTLLVVFLKNIFKVGGLFYPKKIMGKRLMLYVWAYLGLNLFFLVFAFSVGNDMVALILALITNYLILQSVAKHLEALKVLDNYTSYALQTEKPVRLEVGELPPMFRVFGEKINRLTEGMSLAMDDALKNERMRTELITNVTHDLKNPLTSIISYADLLQKEELENQNAKDYSDVIYKKSLKLKDLIDHLVEAAKISSGVSELKLEKLDLVLVAKQFAGEYSETFAEKDLNLVLNCKHESVIVETDPAYYARIMDNLFSNVAKYALAGTRVYLTLEIVDEKAELSLKNISEEELDISENELFERFVRGDKSRTKEGNGLGLSIAKTLARELAIDLKIIIDGDLFKAVLVHSNYEL